MMDDEQNDTDLRKRFAALRAENAAVAPRFRIPEPRPVPRRLPIGLAAAAAVAVAVAGTLWLTRGTEGDALAALGIDLNQTTWTSPTDFLLETPGAEFLGDMPALLSIDSLVGLRAEPTPTAPAIPEDFS
jgi:hypothetical protein